MEDYNIGIALSGGGIRAMIFHLGLFEWLARNKLFEHVRRISSVSGASLCVGMIYSHNNLKWPTNEEFITAVLPSIEQALKKDIQFHSLLSLITSPYYWNKKTNIIAKVLESKWGVHGRLSQLKGEPTWYVNCTTYETGRRFRFCRDNMGDYSIGYVSKPDIPLSEVMAASAGFPILIGPYNLNTANFQWQPSKYSGKNWQPPSDQTLHLWDGGVYDNLGLESIFKPDGNGTLSKGLNYLIVSNASSSIAFQNRKNGITVNKVKRILDISMDQVTSLRSRLVMDFISRTGQGIYIKIGNSAEKITYASGCSEELKLKLINESLSQEQTTKAMNYATTLKRPTESDFRMLLRHGYEVANCTYLCYQKNSEVDSK